MSDLNDSVGSITTLSAEETRHHVHAGPAWYFCESPDRAPDAHAVWHNAGCETCSAGLRALLVERPESASVRWLAGHVEL